MSDSQPPQKRPRLEAQDVPTHSKEFPEGYGDFVFKSTDGVIFHFPLLFLSHVSPVFKDMYQISSGTSNQHMVNLTEDYKTLEYFLSHIDPAKRTPQLNWDRIPGVLEAADKYQVNNILHWFEREVSLLLTPPDHPPLPDPMLCFTLARRYSLHEAAKLSLRELIKCPITKLVGYDQVESRLFQHIVKLRVERTEYLVDLIYGLPENPYEHDHGCSAKRHHPSEKIKMWKWAAAKNVVAEPSWSAIVAAARSIGSLYSGCACTPLEQSKMKKEVKKTEDTLVELSSLS
jgi:hypothetical protein